MNCPVSGLGVVVSYDITEKVMTLLPKNYAQEFQWKMVLLITIQITVLDSVPRIQNPKGPKTRVFPRDFLW